MNIYESKWKEIFEKNCEILARRISQLTHKSMDLQSKLTELESQRETMDFEEYLKIIWPVKEELRINDAKLEKDSKMLESATSEKFDYSIATNFNIKIDNVPVTIVSRSNFVATNNGIFAQDEFKTQEELDLEYTDNIKKINQMLSENKITKDQATDMQERLFFTYGTYIKHAPAKEKEISNSNPQYSKFQGIIAKTEHSLIPLISRKKEIDTQLEELYRQEHDLLKSGLSANDRYYEKIKIQIMQKELELKSMSLEDSIARKKTYIYQKKLGLEKMDEKINAETYAYQMDLSKTNSIISSQESELSYNYLENDLLELKNTLASLQESRGEISRESRENQRKENDEKIRQNDEYIDILVQDIFKERKKAISKEIAFRRKIDFINKATWEAQLNALNSATTLNENSASEIANIYVEESGKTR